MQTALLNIKGNFVCVKSTMGYLFFLFPFVLKSKIYTNENVKFLDPYFVNFFTEYYLPIFLFVEKKERKKTLVCDRTIKIELN